MGARPVFEPLSSYLEEQGSYRLLPFRFARVPGLPGTMLVVSESGEHLFLNQDTFAAFVDKRLDPKSEAYFDLEAKHFLASGGLDTPLRLMAAQYRTRKSYLRHGPSLHIFVATLRCDHSCPYCQVSRQSADVVRFDMDDRTVDAAVDRLFEAPSPALTVEFQGGEPLLAFGVIERAVEAIQARNETERRSILFTMVSTLHHLDSRILAFLKAHDFRVSTSLDGPAWLHNANRPAPGGNAYARTVEGLQKARDALGHDKVAALTTITRAALAHPRKIVDAYVDLGFRSIFLRPLTPLGFAVRSARRIGYEMREFLTFYREALDYILELNRRGSAIEEAYASVLLGHILTPFPTGYVDLRSPSGAGLGALVYNYDGGVYASDEGRMLAEMGDDTFRLGDVTQPYSELIASPAMTVLLNAGVAESLPGCSDCAYLPYCGADPVVALAEQGDPVGHRPTSRHCSRQTGLFELLFEKIARNDPQEMAVLTRWAQSSLLGFEGTAA